MNVTVCRAKYTMLASALTERARRLWAATEALAAGRGGITGVARATGMAVSTIRRGVREVERGDRLAAMSGKVGGGEKGAAAGHGRDHVGGDRSLVEGSRPPRCDGPQGPRQRILRIGILLGGKIVEERLIRERTSVTIGQSMKNTFSIPVEGLPLELTLFALDEDKYSLRFLDKMDGRLSSGDQVNTLDALKGRGAVNHGGMQSNWENGLAVPSLEQWAKMKPMLGVNGETDGWLESLQIESGNRADSRWYQWARGKHSAKPEAFQDIVEQVSPAPRIELFARRQRMGWDSWGNECRNDVDLVLPNAKLMDAAPEPPHSTGVTD